MLNAHTSAPLAGTLQWCPTLHSERRKAIVLSPPCIPRVSTALSRVHACHLVLLTALLWCPVRKRIQHLRLIFCCTAFFLFCNITRRCNGTRSTGFAALSAPTRRSPVRLPPHPNRLPGPLESSAVLLGTHTDRQAHDTKFSISVRFR